MSLGAILIGQPTKIIDSRTFFTKYDQQPDKLPIRYFTQLNPANLQSLTFHDFHGPELELYCQNKVVFRKDVRKLSRPYVFVDFPMKPGDEIYIRILLVDFNYRMPGVIGFTNATAWTACKKIDELPADDITGLYDRKEYWIINEEAFDEKSEELDEYRFSFEKDGTISMSQNNGQKSETRIVAFADASQALYPFLFLNGRVVAFTLFGLVSSTYVKPTVPKPKKPGDDDDDDDDDDDGSCQLCCSKPANCVMLPCGHLFFCSECRGNFESHKKDCPLCRKTITDIIEIEND